MLKKNKILVLIMFSLIFSLNKDGYSDKNKIPCHIINTQKAWVSDNDLEKGTLTISNVEGDRLDFDVHKTVVFVRAGVLDNEVGLALLSTFEKAGAFMINNRDGMLTCDNKMTSYITFNQNGIQTPRTSLINNEDPIFITIFFMFLFII